MDGQNSSIIIPSIVDNNLVMKIRILLVDNDTLCLGFISSLLNMLNYEVVTASSPIDAIVALRVNHASYDMVLSDMQFTSMHGLFFQKIIEQEFRIPVVLMASNPIDNYMLGDLKNGGVYFIGKPPTTIDIKNMWEFVTLRRKSLDIIIKNTSVNNNNNISVNNNNNNSNNISVNNNISVINNNSNSNSNTSNNNSSISSVDVCSQSSTLQQTAHIGSSSSSTISAQQCHGVVVDPNATNSAANEIQESTNNVENKEIVVADEGKKKANRTYKRRKMHWTAPLHDKFVEAIFVIGEDRAVPKKIMEYMNEPSISRENIASHLQKYRIYSRRLAQEAKEEMPPNQIVVQNWGGRSRSNSSQLQDNNNYPFLNPNNNALNFGQLQGAITPTYYNNNATINNNNQFQGNMLHGQNNFNNSIIPNNNNLVHNSTNLNNCVQLVPFKPNTTTFVDFGGNMMNMNNNGYITNNINTTTTTNNNNVPCNNNPQLMSQNGAYFENGLNNNGVDQSDMDNYQQLGFMGNNNTHVIMSKDNHFNATSGGDDFHGLYNNNNVVTATTDKGSITSPAVNGSDITHVTIDGSEQDDIASNMMNNNSTLGDVVSPFMVSPNMNNKNMMMMSTNDQTRVIMSYSNMNTSTEEVALGNHANSTLALGNCANSTLALGNHDTSTMALGNRANSTLALGNCGNSTLALGNYANSTFQLEDVVNQDMSTINFASGSQASQGWLSGNLDDSPLDYSHAADDLSVIFSNVDAYQKGNNNY